MNHTETANTETVNVNVSELIETNKWLFSVLENVGNGIMALQTLRDNKGEIVDFKIRFTNKKTLELTNRRALTGKLLSEEFPGITSLTLFDHYKKVVNTGNPWSGEIPYQHDGFGYWAYVSVVRMEDGCLINFHDITERKRLEEESLMIRKKQQNQIVKAILKAQEEERRRIAEVLHNDLGQLLYITKMKLGKSEKEVEDLLNMSISRTKTISFDLMPAILQDYGLDTALRDLVKRANGPELEITYSNLSPARVWNKDFEIAVFRIVQELLNNILKHSGATKGSILIQSRGDNFFIEVCDNGKGFEVKKKEIRSKGFGLRNISHRVRVFSGTLKIKSEPGNGTRVKLEFPLH